MIFCRLSLILAGLVLAAVSRASAAATLPPAANDFVQHQCVECHDADTKKGDLDLTSLPFDLDSQKTFATWVKIHDRVQNGEMPPKKKARPDAKATAAFLSAIADPMVAADRARAAAQGRSVWRRLNRYEYENVLRDLLHAPWLQIKDMLPEDEESHRFNKAGEALAISHVHMASYLGAAEYALREAMATQVKPPPPTTTIRRYYAREQKAFTGKLKFSQFNTSPERATFPLLGTKAQPEVLNGTAPVSVGAEGDPAIREQEAAGVVASSYEPLELRFEKFTAPVSGHYRLRVGAYSFTAAPLNATKWWVPDRANAGPGRRDEPVTLYAQVPPRQLRLLGSFDVTPDTSGVGALDTWLVAGESIRPDASRLFRSRPSNWHNPLAEKDGTPGVAFRWLEVEGPIYDDKQWPPAGHRLMFGDLPLREAAKPGEGVEVISDNPAADARRLLRNFMNAAYRRPVPDGEVERFATVVDSAMKAGTSFTDAMIAGYSGVLCSPGLLSVEEFPGGLDDYALASRLSFFLWNSAPDDTLRALAAKGELHRPEILRAQTQRLLSDSRSRRFVVAFLDYWLDLRKIVATAPDAGLYPDYYLDDLLTESAEQETQLFFAELLRGNLPASNIASSNFAMLNERLADHYGIPGVKGVNIRSVTLPSDCKRGGLLTQASVLKVTANGTTTSPVQRGAWVMERILGKPPEPPPPNLPVIEPDIRGATTIRAQLDKHRTLASCAACHAKIDPAGFALESFDVMGGFRDHYRANGGDGPLVPGYGHNGQKFAFHLGQPVDPSGELPDGRHFTDIDSLKKLLLADPRQLARNLVSQLIVYSTGAAVRFGDRPEVEKILDRTAPGGYRVRDLITELVQSDLFQSK